MIRITFFPSETNSKCFFHRLLSRCHDKDHFSSHPSSYYFTGLQNGIQDPWTKHLEYRNITGYVNDIHPLLIPWHPPTPRRRRVKFYGQFFYDTNVLCALLSFHDQRRRQIQHNIIHININFWLEKYEENFVLPLSVSQQLTELFFSCTLLFCKWVALHCSLFSNDRWKKKALSFNHYINFPC